MRAVLRGCESLASEMEAEGNSGAGFYRAIHVGEAKDKLERAETQEKNRIAKKILKQINKKLAEVEVLKIKLKEIDQ